MAQTRLNGRNGLSVGNGTGNGVVNVIDNLGLITTTSVNKVAITSPATGSTLTILDGKTLTANNSIVLAGTDGTIMTFPATSATIARTDATNTFTGVQAMTSPALSGTVTGTYSLGGTPTINVATAVGGVWSAAATWTIPAHTLGGTITSNNQSFSGTIANLGTVTTAIINGGSIDNVIIGATTATSSKFTTVQATTFTGALSGNATTATSASTSTNIAGGAIGAIPYQSGVGTTSLLSAGLSGYVLTANGTGFAPTWTQIASVAPPGAGTLGSSSVTTGSTATTVTINFSGAYDANTSSNVTINPIVGPAIVALASTMTGAGSGFLKKSSADTYSLDTSTYITTNQTITLSGDVSGSGTTAITTAIGANKVTLAQMAQMATASLLGRATAGTGNPEVLSVSNVQTLLGLGSAAYVNTVPVTNGGTGQTTLQSAINALTGAVTTGYYLRGNGTNVVMSTIQAGDVPTLNQNTSGNAATVTNATLTTALTVNTGTVTLIGNVVNTSTLTIGVGASSISGSNTGDNAVNSNYASDYRAANFIAGTNYVAPGGALGTPSSGTLTNCTFPILNQNTSGTAAGLSSTLAVGSGGTGTTTLALNNVILGNGTSVVQVVAPSTSGNVLTSNGTTWVSQAISGSGATLGDVVSGTYYPGMSTTNSGVWTSAFVDTTNLYYTKSTSTLNCLAFNATSDSRYKTNIVPIKNGLSVINKMQGVSFNWSENGNKSYGVVAQEIEMLLPTIVETNADLDGKKSVNYNAIIGFLIEAVKEMSAKIDKLENK